MTTTLLFALAPAAQATRRDPADALARGGRGHAGGRHWLQLVLVGAQVSLAIVLLVGAGLLIRSFMRMQNVSTGVDAIYWCGFTPYWPDTFFLVRTDPARAVSIGVIRAAMREIEPNRAVYAIRSLTDSIAVSLSQQRLNAVLIVLFASMALFQAAMGLYGVLSQLVSSRRREIGVRMALGARPAHIVSSVVAQAATVAGLGIAAGIGGALALARFMTRLVFGIPARDPLTFTVVPMVLATVAILTALIPARRAARIDPMTSLRDT